jgi:outer membrane protein assembly factor BamE (lipoprotein component of BamABCDE complex)
MTFARKAAVAAVVAAAAVSACTPTVRRHGYMPEQAPLSAIKPNVDTKTSVLERYGNPSTSGVFDQETWYYITNVSQQLGYMPAQASARAVVAVHFDGAGKVAQVENFTLADGRNPAIVGRKTPTRGREMTILEQLLGNVGRLPTDQITNQDNLPGGAGGPRRE